MTNQKYPEMNETWVAFIKKSNALQQGTLLRNIDVWKFLVQVHPDSFTLTLLISIATRIHFQICPPFTRSTVGIECNRTRILLLNQSFIIAFNSDFIPKIVYLLADSRDRSLSGYVNFTLSYMDISELDLPKEPDNPRNITFCRYLP